MHAARADAIYQGLTGIARKVLDATPLQAAWTAAAICVEMTRIGSHAGKNIVEGCLGSLKDSGLVREPSPGYWQRVLVRSRVLHRVEPTAHQEKPMPTPAAVAPAPTNPLDRLAAVAERLRAEADEIETIALDIESRQEAHHAELAKLRQLRDLLKTV